MKGWHVVCEDSAYSLYLEINLFQICLYYLQWSSLTKMCNGRQAEWHSTGTRLQTGRSGSRIPVGVGDFFLLQNVQTGSETH